MSAPPKDIDPAQLNERDTRFLLLAIQSMRGGEQRMDYQRLSDAAGMSKSTACKAWSRLRKKLDLNFHGESSTPDDAPAKPKPAKRKAAALPVADASEAGGDADGTAAKSECGSDKVQECITVTPKAKRARMAKKAKSPPALVEDESPSDASDADYKHESESEDGLA